MKASVVALAALLSSGFAYPAFAAMEPAGSVDLWPVDTHGVVTYSNLSGDMLAFTARGNADVACRSVTATFADGSSAELFHGVLAPDDQFKIYVPGGVRNIRRMDFDCLSVDRGRAIVDIAADVPGRRIIVPLG
jgi:hypothetical protein